VSYTPSRRRQNMVYSLCHRWMREHRPGLYAGFLREAREKFPPATAGRRPRPEEPPGRIVPVPVMEFRRGMKLLRPMKRRAQ